jgi:polyribonucleotide nucleotidyltransferase
MANDTPGWDQYSRLILQQLESLSTGIDALRQELQEVKRELTEIKAKEDRVQEMKIWKDKIDEIASPRQLKVALDDLDELKVFKTKAVTIFAVVQFFMATALALSSYF